MNKRKENRMHNDTSKFEEKLNSINRRNDSCSTIITPLQPLNTIGQPLNGVGDSTIVDTIIDSEETDYGATNTYVEKNEKKEGEWENYDLICQGCSIPNIVDTCHHCGVYQYVKTDCIFDVQVRRRQ